MVERQKADGKLPYGTEWKDLWESPLDATAQQLVDQSDEGSSGGSQEGSSRTSRDGTDVQSLTDECTSPKTLRRHGNGELQKRLRRYRWHGSTGRPIIRGHSTDTLKIVNHTQLAIDPSKILEILVLKIARNLSISMFRNKTRI